MGEVDIEGGTRKSNGLNFSSFFLPKNCTRVQTLLEFDSEHALYTNGGESFEQSEDDHASLVGVFIADHGHIIFAFGC